MTRMSILVVPLLFGLYHPGCTPEVRPTSEPWNAPLRELWQRPKDIASQDLYYGPWGGEHAPDPKATYTFLDRKHDGTNPGITVTDPDGGEWHVKQPPHNDQGAEGPIEVTVSRVLSAVGYHQPPVYFMPSVTVAYGRGVRVEPGGRFRLSEKSMKRTGEWSWQQNPFVGMRPYQGLLVILLMFNSSDLKNENNVLYELKDGVGVKQWYVVRDLGTALGETGKIAPQRGDPDLFAREPFITGVKDGFVQFYYRGWHQELIKRITQDDVKWACNLLGQLSTHQWNDAFRAGGYSRATADRFIGRLQLKIAEGRQLTAATAAPSQLPVPIMPRP